MLYTIERLSDETGLSRRYLWRECREGRLPHTKPGGRKIILTQKGIDEWLGSTQKKETGGRWRSGEKQPKLSKSKRQAMVSRSALNVISVARMSR